MLKVQEIRELIKLIDQSNIDEFSYEYEGSKIKMKKHKEAAPQAVSVVEQVAQPVAAPPVQQAAPATPAQAVQAPAETAQDNLHKITSPMVGTFYSASSPDAPLYVNVGDKVKADTVVCIVEAMKLFNEIEAEVTGEVVEILVENGQLVEYGQPLFLVKA
ncbi:acetyl-CoA carboxylase biotin carboxyl carrier protein [Litchfieldia alkalitelluris]|uniref:acetyl-CoA carboxylase biotin carboxyl carrier protein n=1 Tax=Litchfieldia alkalitelluris TaxID=304268 RepID=UPI000995E9F9|nr:acetyl-CoA carboxylase biotin carboxyl carrier protein [Litchfieldia alkalitelluris]